MGEKGDLRASALDFFVALHDFAWHYKGGGSTVDLAAYLSSRTGASGWRDSVIYATRFHPSLDNTRAELLTSDGSSDPARILTSSEGYRAAKELISLHNAISAIEVWSFVEYLDSDPTAWPDWLTCVQRAL